MINREIKFRAWTGIEMEYNVVVGNFGAFFVNPDKNGNGLNPEDSASISPANTLYSKETPIMQYTGLKDKNGVEIYEGDIIEGPSWKEPIAMKTSLISIYSVECSNGGGWGYKFWLKLIGKGYRTYPNFNECKIIGNIYNNPELLK